MTASTRSGAGRVLVAVYGVFALAATARSLVQLFTKADEAPLAYALSALAAVVYIAATLGLAEVGPSPRRRRSAAWRTASIDRHWSRSPRSWSTGSSPPTPPRRST